MGWFLLPDPYSELARKHRFAKKLAYVGVWELLSWRPSLSGWRPSLLGWRLSLLGWRPLLLIRLEAIAIRLEAIACRLEAIASRSKNAGVGQSWTWTHLFSCCGVVSPRGECGVSLSMLYTTSCGLTVGCLSCQQRIQTTLPGRDSGFGGRLLALPSATATLHQALQSSCFST